MTTTPVTISWRTAPKEKNPSANPAPLLTATTGMLDCSDADYDTNQREHT